MCWKYALGHRKRAFSAGQLRIVRQHIQIRGAPSFVLFKLGDGNQRLPLLIVFAPSQLKARSNGLRPLQRRSHRLERLMDIVISGNHGLHIINLKASETWPPFLRFDKLKLKTLRLPRMPFTDPRILLSSHISPLLFKLRYRRYVQRLNIQLFLHTIWNSLRRFKLLLQTQANLLGVSAFGLLAW